MSGLDIQISQNFKSTDFLNLLVKKNLTLQKTLSVKNKLIKLMLVYCFLNRNQINYGLL